MTTTEKDVAGKELSDFIVNLFGIKTDVSPAPAISNDSLVIYASYVDDADDVRGYIACDIACGAILGAALTQIPMGAVEDCIKSGELSSSLKENLHEVLNIAVSLIPHQASKRVVLKDVTIAEGAPEITGLTSSEDYVMKMARYGSGSLRIIGIS